MASLMIDVVCLITESSWEQKNMSELAKAMQEKDKSWRSRVFYYRLLDLSSKRIGP